MKPIAARFAHTNLIANDWQMLSKFYIDVFGCEVVPPQRDLSGEWLEYATLVPEAQLEGVHLRLPGCGSEGPTLEIFSYNKVIPRQQQHRANTPGFSHIAFRVEDVGKACDAVFSSGGSEYGARVTIDIEGAGKLTFVYVLDPEGNIIELQKWE